MLDRIKLFSWNILGSKLCLEENYSAKHYQHEAFDNEKRVQIIIDKVSSKMKDDYLIVLHEVDVKINPILLELCDEYHYTMVTQGRGNLKKGNIASAIIWPYKIWSDLSINVVNISNLIRRDKGIIRQEYAAEEIKNSYLLDVYLENQNMKINIAAYHFPCLFRTPNLMMSHAREVSNLLKNRESAILLCIDGNFMPTTKMYSVFIDNNFESASVISNDQEPLWTCNSNSHWGGEFRGTIDYVWLKNIGYKSVSMNFPHLLSLPLEDLPYLPTPTFPSDHIWLDMVVKLI